MYALPVFRNNRFDETGAPVVNARKALGRLTDYRRVKCPQAERVAFHEHVTVSAQALNFKQNGRIYARVFRKLWKHIDELRK